MGINDPASLYPKFYNFSDNYLIETSLATSYLHTRFRTRSKLLFMTLIFGFKMKKKMMPIHVPSAMNLVSQRFFYSVMHAMPITTLTALV